MASTDLADLRAELARTQQRAEAAEQAAAQARAEAALVNAQIAADRAKVAKEEEEREKAARGLVWAGPAGENAQRWGDLYLAHARAALTADTDVRPFHVGLSSAFHALSLVAIEDVAYARAEGANPLGRHFPEVAQFQENLLKYLKEAPKYRQELEALGQPYRSSVSPEQLVDAYAAHLWPLVGAILAAADAKRILNEVETAYTDAGFPPGYMLAVPACAEVVVTEQNLAVEGAEAMDRMRQLNTQVANFIQARHEVGEALKATVRGMTSNGVVVMPREVARPGAYGDLLAALGFERPELPIDLGPDTEVAVVRMITRDGKTQPSLYTARASEQLDRIAEQEARIRRKRRWGF